MAERHIVEGVQLYLDSVAQEAEDRSSGNIHGFRKYLDLRYHTSAGVSCLALTELELEFPEEVYRHPMLQKLRDCAAYSIIAINVGTRSSALIT